MAFVFLGLQLRRRSGPMGGHLGAVHDVSKRALCPPIRLALRRSVAPYDLLLAQEGFRSATIRGA